MRKSMIFLKALKKIQLLKIITVVLIGGMANLPLFAETFAGVIPGTFSAGTGGAGYSISLQPAPGVNGLQPQLSVVYNSTSGSSGILGVGFYLGGLSTITRCGATRAEDGFTGSVNFNDRDRLCMEGQPLKHQGGNYWDTGREYRNLREGFSKIVSEGSCGQGPCSFTVYGTKGRRFTYGGNTGSRIAAAGRSDIRTWALNQVQDRNGNTMNIAYSERGGHALPVRITYGHRTVVLTYVKSRDVVRGYVGGSAYFMDRLLYRVDMYAGSNRFKRYQFSYGYGQRTGRARLNQVDECDGDGNCLEPTRFNWSDSEFKGEFYVRTPSGNKFQDWLRGDPGANIITGDFNGDGKTDFLRQSHGDFAKAESNTFQVYLSRGDGYFLVETPAGHEYQSWLRFDQGANIIPGDYNGDGKTDFIRQEKGDWGKDESNTFQVYFSNGDGTFNVVTPAGDNYQHWLRFDNGANIIPGDFNGDGKTDFLRQEKGEWSEDLSNTFNVYFSRGNGEFDVVTPSGEQYQSWLRFEQGANIITGDYNGDGKMDFLRQEKGDWGLDTSNTFNVYLSQGNGYFDIVTPAGEQFQSWLRFDQGANIIPGDYNGDGMTDFIRQEKGDWDDNLSNTFNVYFSKGNGQFEIVTPEGTQYQDWLRFDPGTLIIPGDFNGDGKSDFIRQEKGDWDNDESNNFNIYVSKGDGRFDVQTPAGDIYQRDLRFDPGVNIIPGDFNGDGRLDFIRQEKNDLDDDTARSFSVYFNEGPQADLVSSIEEGKDIRHELTYKTMADDSVYVGADFNSEQLRHFQGALNLLYSYRKKDLGTGAEVYSTYRYFYARISKIGRGFMGFQRVDVSNETLGILLRRYQHTEFPLNGKVYHEISYKLSNNQKLTEKRYTWSGKETAQNSFLTQLSQEREWKFESNGSFEFKKSYTYDAYGNLALLQDQGDVSHGNDDLNTCAVYKNDTAAWHLAFQTERFQAASCSYNAAANSCACSGVLNRERTTFDGNSNPATIEKWVDTNDSWLKSSYVYDGFGNLIRATDPAGKVTEVEYESVYNTYPARRIDDAAGLRLITSTEYDPRFGSLVQKTDANGNTFSRGLDSFGRLTEVRAPNLQGQSTVIRKISHFRNGLEMVSENLERISWDTDTWRRTRQFRDGFGRTLRESIEGDSSTADINTLREYDARGRLERESLPFFTGETPQWRSYTYDSEGRPLTVNLVNGATASITYSLADQSSCPGALTQTRTVTGARIRVECRDSRGRVLRRLNNSRLAGSFIYDLLGRKTNYQDSKVETTIAFDSLGRRTTAESTNTGKVQYTYDARGRLSHFTDALNHKVNLSYDTLGRVASRTFFDNRKTIYEYDDGAFTNSTGRLTRLLQQSAAGDKESVREYAYDRRGKISASSLTLEGKNYSMSYVYDPAGEILSHTYPDGSVMSLQRNSVGFVSGVNLDAVQMAAYTNYTAVGQPGKVNFANGVESLMSYDDANRLSSKQTDALDETGGVKTALKYNYSWTTDNEITRIYDRLNSENTRQFAYDALGFLKNAEGVYGSLSYAYDAAGNLTQKDGVNYTYSGHQLRSGSNGLSLSYDLLGRRRAKSLNGHSWEYAYHSSGRMASVKKDGALVAAYQYDGSGARIKKTDKDGGVSIYVSPLYEITRFSGGRELHTRYLNGPGGRIAAVSNEFSSVALGMLQHSGYGVHSSLYNSSSVSGLTGFMGDTMLFYASHPLAELYIKYTLLVLAALAFSLLFGYYFFRSAAIDSHIGQLRVLFAERMVALDFWNAEQAEAFAVAGGTDFMREHRRKSVVMPALVFCFTAFFVMNCGADKPADVRHLVQGFLGTQVLDNGLLHTNLQKSLLPGDNGAGYPVPGTYFYHQDQVGSSNLITDARGVETARAVYKPFGELYQPASSGFDIFRSKFGGKEWDRDVDLYYFNARYYDAEIGRFATADSYLVGGADELPTALNRYHFAGNNPITYTDPSGNLVITGTAIALAIIIGAIAGGAAYAINTAISGGSFEWGAFAAAVGIGAFVGFAGLLVGVAAFNVFFSAISAAVTSFTGVALTVTQSLYVGVAASALAGAVQGAATTVISELIKGNRDVASIARRAAIGAAIGAVFGAASHSHYTTHLRQETGKASTTLLSVKGLFTQKTAKALPKKLFIKLGKKYLKSTYIKIAEGGFSTEATSVPRENLVSSYGAGSNQLAGAGDVFATAGNDLFGSGSFFQGLYSGLEDYPLQLR